MISYKKEHLSCISYKTDDAFGFKHVKVSAKGTINFSTDRNHCLLFLLEGNIHFQIQSVDVSTRRLTSKEALLIPKGAVYSYEVRHDSELIIFSFRALKSVCDKLYINQIPNDNTETIEPLSPIAIRYPLNNFLSTLAFYLDEGLNCDHLHEIKEKELFLILRAFYSKKEMAKLFHEIIGESDFRSLIIHNYMKVDNVGELAALANMGRTTFDCKFKSVFGTSARQWMLNQIAKQVKVKAMDPDVTISDLMQEFNFNSATHFNWFCKKQFKCTPLELIRSCRKSWRDKHFKNKKK